MDVSGPAGHSIQTEKQSCLDTAKDFGKIPSASGFRGGGTCIKIGFFWFECPLFVLVDRQKRTEPGSDKEN